MQGWCNASIAKRLADGNVLLDWDDGNPLSRVKRLCNVRHRAVRVQWIGALSNVIAEREAAALVAAQASPVSPASDSYSQAACVKMKAETDPPQRLQQQQTHTALMQPLHEAHETKTGLLWAEAEETMEKTCCVEEFALPAVVSATEYADSVNRPHGEAWVGRVVHKSLQGFGRFQDKVVEYRVNDDLFAIQYDDGDAENLNESKMRALLPRPHKPADVSADATKRHEHDTRSPEEEAKRDRQWIGFDQGNACVRKRRPLRCDAAVQNVHMRSRAGARGGRDSRAGAKLLREG